MCRTNLSLKLRCPLVDVRSCHATLHKQQALSTYQNSQQNNHGIDLCQVKKKKLRKWPANKPT